jgi:hypothetical protein
MDTKQFCYISTPPQSSILIVLAMSPSLEEELCTGSDWRGNMSLLSNMYFKCKLASKESHNSYNSLPLARWEPHSVGDSFPCQLRANNHILTKTSHFAERSVLDYQHQANNASCCPTDLAGCRPRPNLLGLENAESGRTPNQ